MGWGEGWDWKGVDIRRYSRTCSNTVFPIKVRPDRSGLRQVLMKHQPAGKLATGKLLKGLLASYFGNRTGPRGFESVKM